MLPVEFTEPKKEWNFNDLSWESIISAMLKILAYNPSHKDSNYYRQFIVAVKPDIKNELTKTGIIKAKNKDYDLAIEIFKALEGLFPDSGITNLNLAMVYEDRGHQYGKINNLDLEEKYRNLAFETYKKAVSLTPHLPEAYFNFAHFYLNQNMKLFLYMMDMQNLRKE